MKRFNICKAEPYTKNGTEKTNWQKVGELIQFDNGNMMIKIPAIGLEANVFEQKDKEDRKDYGQVKSQADGGMDMPF